MPWRDEFKGEISLSIGDDGVSLMIITKSKTMQAVQELALQQPGAIQ